MFQLIMMAAVTQMTLADLQTLCATNTPSETCRLYVLGVAEGVTLGAGVAKEKAPFCLPSDLPADAMTKVELLPVPWTPR